MRALVNTPRHPQHIEFADCPDPSPREDEALVSVAAFSLNRGELGSLSRTEAGWLPGQDLAGTVLVQARSGQGPAVGTRVVGLVDEGSWAERVVVSATRLAPLPDEVSFEQAAALPIAGLTALCIVRLGGFLLGKRVLVTGASGGVGHFAVQIAALAGAEVTAVARSEHEAALRQSGARQVVGEVGQAEGLFDHILESVGGASLEAALTRVAPRGAIVSFGNSSAEDARFNFAKLRGHEGARIQTFFSYASGSEEEVGLDLSLLARLVGERRLTVELARVADWVETGRLLQELRERRFAGKAVLRVAR